MGDASWETLFQRGALVSRASPEPEAVRAELASAYTGPYGSLLLGRVTGVVGRILALGLAGPLAPQRLVAVFIALVALHVTVLALGLARRV